MSYCVNIKAFRNRLNGYRIMRNAHSLNFLPAVNYDYEGIYCTDCFARYCYEQDHAGARYHGLTILSVNPAKVLSIILDVPEEDVNEEFLILCDNVELESGLEHTYSYEISGWSDTYYDDETLYVKLRYDHGKSVDKLRTMYAEFIA